MVQNYSKGTSRPFVLLDQAIQCNHRWSRSIQNTYFHYFHKSDSLVDSPNRALQKQKHHRCCTCECHRLQEEMSPF